MPKNLPGVWTLLQMQNPSLKDLDDKVYEIKALLFSLLIMLRAHGGTLWVNCEPFRFSNPLGPMGDKIRVTWSARYTFRHMSRLYLRLEPTRVRHAACHTKVIHP
jgi:hypothetical protein